MHKPAWRQERSLMLTAAALPAPVAPSSPPWPRAEGPVNSDGQSEQLRAIEVVNGCLGLLPGLVLHQSIALETKETKSTPCTERPIASGVFPLLGKNA